MKKLLDKETEEMVEDLYTHLQPYCKSIYLGGSIVEGLVEHPHDLDFICIGEVPEDMCHLRREIYFYFHRYKKRTLREDGDFIQVRNKQQEEHAYGSYINKKMIKLIGDDVEFTFDVIDKDRKEYINILLHTIDQIETGVILNQKRWYQIYRGYCILLNNSYDVTDEQRKIINIIHDQEEGGEKYIKGIKEGLISEDKKLKGNN